MVEPVREQVQEVTRELARYLVASRFADIPRAVRHEARRTLHNWLGCAVGGCRDPAVGAALAAVRDISGPPQASVLGRADRLDIMNAALLNGIASHVDDFDDTQQRRIIIHPAGPVAAAALALAEHKAIAGEDFLHALILGIEVECRVANAVYPYYDVGWMTTSTAGVLGAAAATGCLLQLDDGQLARALGIAATQAAGLRVHPGTMSKSFNVGSAAQRGLLASLLAAQDFTASEHSIEGIHGFAEVMGEDDRLSAITEGLGQTFEVSWNTYKAYPCGMVLFPIIDGCIQLRQENEMGPQHLQGVSLQVNPLVLDLSGNMAPRNGMEAKFSVNHVVAAAFDCGAVGVAQFADEYVLDPAIITLRDQVAVHADPAVERDAAAITIETKDGQKLSKYIDHCRGSLDRPLSDDELDAKFGALVEHVLTKNEAKKLIGLCWSVDALDDVGILARAALPALSD
ncbi:MAG: MmgE/PrpD family protein [Alphaproteobacteria bacterium]|jgi:2-methylcitrate dehydratase PrpD|nr:MmgE/PrpD family protein [Alphaproteobacteria bacterium]